MDINKTWSAEILPQLIINSPRCRDQLITLIKTTRAYCALNRLLHAARIADRLFAQPLSCTSRKTFQLKGIIGSMEPMVPDGNTTLRASLTLLVFSATERIGQRRRFRPFRPILCWSGRQPFLEKAHLSEGPESATGSSLNRYLIPFFKSIADPPSRSLADNNDANYRWGLF